MSNQSFDQVWTSVFDDGAEPQGAEGRLAADVRDALRSMREVPECQLSAERLRNAILGRSVRRGPDWGAALSWIGGAAAAFTLLAVAVTQFPGNTTGSPLSHDNAGGAVALESDAEPPDPIKEALGQDTVAADPPEASVEPEGSEVAESSVTVPRVTRRSQPAPAGERPAEKQAGNADAIMGAERGSGDDRASDGTAESTALAARSGVGGGGGDLSLPTTGALFDPGAASLNMESDGDDSIVVVTSEYEAETGATRATEVTFDSDFVFRG